MNKPKIDHAEALKHAERIMKQKGFGQDCTCPDHNLARAFIELLHVMKGLEK